MNFHGPDGGLRISQRIAAVLLLLAAVGMLPIFCHAANGADEQWTSDRLKNDPALRCAAMLQMLQSDYVLFGTVKQVPGKTSEPALELVESKVLLGATDADIEKVLSLSSRQIPDGYYLISGNPEWTHVRKDNPHPKRIATINTLSAISVTGPDDPLVKSLTAPAADNIFRHENWKAWADKSGIEIHVVLLNAGELFMPGLADTSLLPMNQPISIRIDVENKSKESIVLPKGVLLEGITIVALADNGTLERRLNVKAVRESGSAQSPLPTRQALEWIELSPGSMYSKVLTTGDLIASPLFRQAGKYQVFAVSPLRLQKQNLAQELKSMDLPDRSALIPYSEWALDKSTVGRVIDANNCVGEPVIYNVVDPKTYQPKNDH